MVGRRVEIGNKKVDVPTVVGAVISTDSLDEGGSVAINILPISE